jgi:hypothetical protein
MYVCMQYRADDSFVGEATHSPSSLAISASNSSISGSPSSPTISKSGGVDGSSASWGSAGGLICVKSALDLVVEASVMVDGAAATASSLGVSSNVISSSASAAAAMAAAAVLAST